MIINDLKNGSTVVDFGILQGICSFLSNLFVALFENLVPVRMFLEVSKKLNYSHRLTPTIQANTLQTVNNY